MSDFYIQTNEHVVTNQSGVVLIDREDQKATIIDLAVPRDYCRAGNKKVEKYHSS